MTGNFNIEYMTQIWQEGDQFVAHAMPLDVMSSGATVEAAREALTEAVELFLVTTAEAGNLEDVLVESGYEFKDESWHSPVWIATERRAAAVGV